MKLTHSQISEIISNYTSSSKVFVTLQSLIINSSINHERKLFVKEHEDKIKMDNVIVFVLVIGIVTALSFSQYSSLSQW